MSRCDDFDYNITLYHSSKTAPYTGAPPGGCTAVWVYVRDEHQAGEASLVPIPNRTLRTPVRLRARYFSRAGYSRGSVHHENIVTGLWFHREEDFLICNIQYRIPVPI